MIIFGALLFLKYLNGLSGNGTALAISIIAVIVSAYYLAIGIVGVIAANKLSAPVKKVFEVISVSLFGVFMFVVFLLTTISGAKINNMGPTAWTIQILSMVGALAFVVVYIASRFANKQILVNFAYLFSAIFALALLLNILFSTAGVSRALGAIDVLLVAIYLAFCFYLFNTLGAKQEEAPAKENEAEEQQEEEPASEETQEE